MSTTPAFSVRGIETHTRHMWEWEHVKRMLEFAVQTRLNALVFHQNDLIDMVAYPERYLSRDMMKKAFPVYMHAAENNRCYIRKVAALSRELGIDFFLEVKELWYRNYLLASYPDLAKNGTACPNHPFWWEYLPAKLESLFGYIPELSGIIMSIGSKESRLSLRNTRCRCEVCQRTPAQDWYRKVIDAMYQPIRNAGKRLVIRDFVYSPKDLNEVVSATESAPADVVISLKNTPHDYYPCFPHNPRIGHVGNHEQWIEYDVWGQFFGWGVFPCILLEDMKQRMEYALAQGVTGFIARTDWECMSEGTALDGVNKLNLYGTARLSYDLNTDFWDIYREWLEGPASTSFSASDIATYRGIERGAGQVDIAGLQSVLQETWSVIRNGIFLGGCVFHEDSMFPVSLDDAWWTMQENHSLADWDPTKASALEMTPENIRRLIGEKDLALTKIQSLADRLRQDNNRMGLNPPFYADLVRTFEMYVLYIEGFSRCAKACVLTKNFLTTQTASAKREASAAIRELAMFAARLRQSVSRITLLHYVYMLVDPDRLDALVEDLKSRIGG